MASLKISLSYGDVSFAQEGRALVDAGVGEAASKLAAAAAAGGQRNARSITWRKRGAGWARGDVCRDICPRALGKGLEAAL